MIQRLHLDRLARRCSEIREIQASVGMWIQTKIPRSVRKETCDLSVTADSSQCLAAWGTVQMLRGKKAGILTVALGEESSWG